MKTFIRSTEAVLIELRLRGAGTVNQLISRLKDHGLEQVYANVHLSLKKLEAQKLVKVERKPVEEGKPEFFYNVTALGVKRAEKTIKLAKDFLGRGK